MYIALYDKKIHIDRELYRKLKWKRIPFYQVNNLLSGCELRFLDEVTDDKYSAAGVDAYLHDPVRNVDWVLQTLHYEAAEEEAAPGWTDPICNRGWQDVQCRLAIAPHGLFEIYEGDTGDLFDLTELYGGD